MHSSKSWGPVLSRPRLTFCSDIGTVSTPSDLSNGENRHLHRGSWTGQATTGTRQPKGGKAYSLGDLVHVRVRIVLILREKTKRIGETLWEHRVQKRVKREWERKWERIKRSDRAKLDCGVIACRWWIYLADLDNIVVRLVPIYRVRIVQLDIEYPGHSTRQRLAEKNPTIPRGRPEGGLSVLFSLQQTTIARQYCYTVKTLNYCEQAAPSQGIPNTLASRALRLAVGPRHRRVIGVGGYPSVNQSGGAVDSQRGIDRARRDLARLWSSVLVRDIPRVRLNAAMPLMRKPDDARHCWNWILLELQTISALFLETYMLVALIGIYFANHYVCLRGMRWHYTGWISNSTIQNESIVGNDWSFCILDVFGTA